MKYNNMQKVVDQLWDEAVLPGLCDFIKIPSVSPYFDKDWQANGKLTEAAQLMIEWAEKQNIAGLTAEIVQLPDRSPLLLVDVQSECDKTTMFYGHLDVMPEFVGWDDDLGPWQPVVRDGKLFGRGGVDDGYSFYSALAAIKALQMQGIKHPRCILLIEACEESGSYDFASYLDHLCDRLPQPDVVVCLDVSAHDYERMWCTTSLRGVIALDLKIKLLNSGLHSGVGGGIVPDISRILRILLKRIENTETGEFLLPSLQVSVPEERATENRQAAAILGDRLYKALPLAENVKPIGQDPAELLLGRTWSAAMSITGISGFSTAAEAGNVMVPAATVHLSFRIPPSANKEQCIKEIEDKLTSNSPYGVGLDVEFEEAAGGWNSGDYEPWLHQALAEASQDYFGNDVVYLGEGGTIGFVPVMKSYYPKAQFVTTGLVGPDSYAHAANENLDIAAGKKLTACVAHLLAEHCQN